MSTSETPRKKGFGGPKFHRDPNCGCNYCTARRRKEETALVADREGRIPVVTQAPKKGTEINADNPFVITQGRTARDRVAQWISLRQQEPGISGKEIARRLGISPQHLYDIISRAKKEGWLTFSDPLSRIEYEIIPKTLDNVSLFLDQRDKQVTIEAFKNTIAKQYQESKGFTDAPKTVIALKIEMPDTVGDDKVITGTVVGQPKVSLEE